MVEEDIKTEKKCFFITPIGSEDSNDYRKLTALVENVLNRVLEKFDYEIIIAHTINSIGSIGDQVFYNILNADLIISNITGLNPNVMYETAVAHSFGKPTIMISEKSTKLPFDLIGDRTIFFDDSIEGTGKLIFELENKIKLINSDENSDIDNPIVRVLGKKAVEEDLVGRTDDSSRMIKLLMDIEQKLDKQSHLIVNKNMGKNNVSSIKKVTSDGEYLIKLNPRLHREKIEEICAVCEEIIVNSDETLNTMRVAEVLNIPADKIKNMVRILPNNQ
ncbi:hypothetical protein OL233_08155 [Vagococcus sp. PNs007]|uniref:Nucleoside 2-deoxyribosyltransferase n=1 Tax=Vagococcus proximus TaxID=2991417 RepID=A0ABT5X2M3_9ENTE|nr:hypothetical protein [Vagococcus proximus]MDF0480254.1 hypothetical protein [Vagococcus proximus]